MLGYLFWSISFFFHRGDPLVAEIPQPNLVAKSADFSKISKKKNFFFFFSQVFLRPAHYTLGTLLRPKSQKKHELGCFEHLEFIPQPFSVPPVHFVWASALSKNRKISKKKKGKPLFGSQKVIFPSFGSQNKIFPSFYQSYYNFSFIRLTKVNFSTILSIFCQFFHHSIKVFFFTFSKKFLRWKKKNWVVF